MKRTERWIGLLSVAGLLLTAMPAWASNLCPYDTTGNFDYYPGGSPEYVFYGDDAITYSGAHAWYMDDVYACYEAYKNAAYLPIFPKCDLNGDGVVGRDELDAVYFRVHPVGQSDSIAQSACVEAVGSKGFVFCPRSKYHRAVTDLGAIVAAYPATEAVLDSASSGLGHVPSDFSFHQLTCSTPSGLFPANAFDSLNECYSASTACGADCSDAIINFSSATNTLGVSGEYAAIAATYGGTCGLVPVTAHSGTYVPGFHFFEYTSSTNRYKVRTTAQCVGDLCDCDLTYFFVTNADQPGAVVLAYERDDSNEYCTDLRFPGGSACSDNDDDGVCNVDDNCVDVSNVDQSNTDGDAFGDACDVCPGDAMNDEDGDGVCGDVDPCPLDPNPACGITCEPGFELVGTVCVDIDECAQGSDDCHADATCTNTVGSFTCACDAGYTGDGVTCTDIDECSLGTDSCDVNATCENNLGSYTCACNTGYTGDGFTCEPSSACPTGDDDDDGVCNDVDNCPLTSNPDQEDYNNNGEGDLCDDCPFGYSHTDPDADYDGDGVLDCFDECAYDVTKVDSGICGCGVPDEDSDSDGYYNCQEPCFDDPDKQHRGLCGCGVPEDHGDDDEDGIMNCLDQCEGYDDNADADEGGLPDACDPCPDGGCAPVIPDTFYAEFSDIVIYRVSRDGSLLLGYEQSTMRGVIIPVEDLIADPQGNSYYEYLGNETVFGFKGFSDDNNYVLAYVKTLVPELPGVHDVAAIYDRTHRTWRPIPLYDVNSNVEGCHAYSTPADMTSDGRYVYGTTLTDDGCHNSGFRYDTLTGTWQIYTGPEGSVQRIESVSGSGEVIVGSAQDVGTQSGLWWFDEPDVYTWEWMAEGGYAVDVSDDGSYVGLLAFEGSTGKCFRWHAISGLQRLGQGTLDSAWACRPLGVNDDGTVIVGNHTYSLATGLPFFWKEGLGFGRMADYLVYRGHTYIGGMGDGYSSLDVSGDGKVVVGDGTSLSRLPGWVAITKNP